MDKLISKNSFSSQNQKSKNENIKDNTKKPSLNKCCKRFCSFIILRKKKCITKCSIFFQFFILILPVSILLGVILTLIHIHLFTNKFKIDYYTLIKDEYLQYLITDVDDQRFYLRLNEIKTHFDDKGNIFFFKFYFEELISLGLLDEDEVKIFPNISDLSDSLYKSVDKMSESNNIYTIPTNLSKVYIDERNDAFSELSKIYFHFYPIMSLEGFKGNSYINQSYLIAYQIDNDNQFLGNELYFNFPRLNGDYLKDNIFSPGNHFISPIISKTELETYKLIDNTYYQENWFVEQDYNFRKMSSEEYDLKIGFWHLNDISGSTIVKSYIHTLQTYIKRKDKKFIINIIYYNPEEKIIKNFFDYTVFIVDKESESFVNQTYSDNQTFVISQNDINEIVLSTLPNQYFHFGLKNKDYNFYKNGIFYNYLDINHLSEPSKYYSTIKGFNFDIRFFSPFYLYTKLFQKSSFTKSFSEIHNIKVFFFEDKDLIKDICSEFNFNLYYMYLKENNVDCFDKNNLFYYSYVNESSKDSVADLISLPYCICLPLFCIKNLEQSFDSNNIQFVEQINLPEKCQNKLLFYENKIYNDSDDNDTLFYEDNCQLQNLLEDEHMMFGTKKYGISNEISYMIICIFNNKSLRNILHSFIIDVNKVCTVHEYISILGISLLFILSYTLLLFSTNKIASSLYQYEKQQKQFIIKLENKFISGSKENNSSSENKSKDDLFQANKEDDNTPLVKYENFLNKDVSEVKNAFIINENKLIDDLFMIYCNYYKSSEESLLRSYFKKNKCNKSKIKYEIMQNSNELFNLFCLMSVYTPKFILNINIDFNLFNDAKFLNNFLKLIREESSSKHKEQIIPTKSIIYEFLSTELVTDYGFITNLNFNYLTVINFHTKEKMNSIQNGILRVIKKKGIKLNDLGEELMVNKLNHENEIIKLVYKNKSLIMKKIEEKFEQDDYLQLNKLESTFNSFLINTCFNYLKRIELEKKENKNKFCM